MIEGALLRIQLLLRVIHVAVIHTWRNISNTVSEELETDNEEIKWAIQELKNE